MGTLDIDGSKPVQHEAYNYASRSGRLEVDNVYDRRGSSASDKALVRRLAKLLDAAMTHEIQAPLPAPLQPVQDEAMKDRLLPRFDQSFATLLEDLDDRRLLDETLVVCMGEFGRAPRIALEPKFAGSSPGRKHWANTYSVVVAGAGVSRGAVFGESDRIAGYPVSDRVAPWDLAATMFASLGVDPAAEYFDLLARPFPITVGRPIAGLYRG